LYLLASAKAGKEGIKRAPIAISIRTRKGAYFFTIGLDIRNTLNKLTINIYFAKVL
jgi:hypothetical protein